MAEIFPFPALTFDPARVALGNVVTQPYDKITPAMQGRYYELSPYNLVRIILGKTKETDNREENAYTRAAADFHHWRAAGILQPDSQPSIYRYVQTFTAPGRKQEQSRSGFIALGKVEDYSAGVVFRHEQTLAKPKADRLDLLRATRAHFGQVFMLYSDPEGKIEAALNPASAPDMEVRDEYDVTHQVWRISDPYTVALVQKAMQGKQLIIADGHHRYETALNYRNERRANGGNSDPTKQAPYDLLMMTFVNMDSPGLLVLPTHRVVHGLRDFSADAFKSAARVYYSVDEVDPAINAQRATIILREAGHSGTAFLAVTNQRAFLIDTPRSLGVEVFRGLSVRQQALDVVHLHKCLLESVLGLSEESIRNQENIRYLRDAAEALELVREGDADIVFLMNPVRMTQLRNLAFAGEVLPQKSTDFYPKLLSGLTIYALE